MSRVFHGSERNMAFGESGDESLMAEAASRRTRAEERS